MSGVVQFADGYPSMLASWLDGLVAYCHLYTNDPDLSVPHVLTDFVEVVYDRYAAQLVGPWTPPTMRDGRAISVMDPLAFTFIGGPEPLPVRGYYVTAGLAGPLLWAWRKDGDAFQMTLATPTVNVYLTARWPLVLG